MVTKTQLQQFLPDAKPVLIKAVVHGWTKAEAAGITSLPRIRQFLANIAVETQGLTRIEENLNYTSAQRIYDVFKGPAKARRFKSVAECVPYVRKPKQLAIKVYGGRLGNRPAPSTDGWDYRGGGMMQTTGRDNYRKQGFDANPQALRTPDTAFETAVLEWWQRGCNGLADKGDTAGIRKKIQGGSGGLDDVKAYLKRAEKVFTTAAAPAPAPKPGDSVYTQKVMVESVQKRLMELGYTEVGGVDGLIGPLTRAAILAFRDDAGLELVPTVDEELMRALATAKPRQLTAEREQASPDYVRAKVPEVQANFFSKVISAGTAVISAVGALLSGVLDNLGGARGAIEPVREFASDVPGPVWLGVVAAIAALLFMINRHGEKTGVEAFRSGERR